MSDREPPYIGTEEARKRIRESGVPFDEWVTVNDETRRRWTAEAAQRNRRLDKRFNIVMALIVAAVLIIPALWACAQGAPEGEPPENEIEEQYR